jgi:hypothetical protein
MAAKTKSTFARAQASLTRALRDFEKTISGMMSSAPAPKAKKKAKTKKKKAPAKSRKRVAAAKA